MNLISILAISISLPLLAAFLAYFSGQFTTFVSGTNNTFLNKLRNVLLICLLAVLVWKIVDEWADISQANMVWMFITSFITFAILSGFRHSHNHTDHGAVNALVLVSVVHSLVDGLAVGVAASSNFIIGIGALFGVLLHEFLKIFGLASYISASEKKMHVRIFKSFISQIGFTIGVLVVYTLGEIIKSEAAATIELITVASLASAIIFICYKEYKFHNDHRHN